MSKLTDVIAINKLFIEFIVKVTAKNKYNTIFCLRWCISKRFHINNIPALLHRVTKHFYVDPGRRGDHLAAPSFVHFLADSAFRLVSVYYLIASWVFLFVFVAVQIDDFPVLSSQTQAVVDFGNVFRASLDGVGQIYGLPLGVDVKTLARFWLY